MLAIQILRLTHNLTQNRKNSGGTNGQKSGGKDVLPDTIGLESAINACFPALRAATDQKAGGSNPSRRAKANPRILREYGDFSLFLGCFAPKSYGLLMAVLALPQQIPLTGFFLFWGICRYGFTPDKNSPAPGCGYRTVVFIRSSSYG